MFRSIYTILEFTAGLCLLIKFIYHLYKKLTPFPKATFLIPGTRLFLFLIYVLVPIKYLPNDSKENKIKRALNYGLLYYYLVGIFLFIGETHFDKIAIEKAPKQVVTVVDSNSIVKPISDSEKAAIKDSFNMELKKPTF